MLDSLHHKRREGRGERVTLPGSHSHCAILNGPAFCGARGVNVVAVSGITFGEVQKQGEHLRKKSAGPGDLGSIGKAAVEEEGLILVMLHIKTFRT